MYDDINRLKAISYKVGNEVLRSNNYTFGVNEKIYSQSVSKNGNVQGQWRYTYNDSRFGLASATLYSGEGADAAAMPYSAYAYSFDSAGNPESVSQIGSRNFTSNAANQTSQISKSADFARAYFGSAETSASLTYKIGGVWQPLARAYTFS